jgi:hypothetical protein
VLVPVTAGLLALAGGVYFLSGGCDPDPSADWEGVRWSYPELGAYLERRGVPTRTVNYQGHIYFRDAATDLGEDVEAAAAAENGMFDDHIVRVARMDDPQEAGAAAEWRPDESHHWGQFFFRGKGKLLARIRAVLR